MKKISLIFTLLLMLALILCACGKKQTEENKGSSEGKISVAEITELESYTVVRSENASAIEKDAMQYLRDTLKEKLGAELPVSTDWKSRQGKEIIIGNTKRAASVSAAEALKTDFDYIIKLSGDDIVILGGSDEATAEAVEVFLKNFITGGKLYAPTGDGYIQIVSTTVESSDVAGKDLSEFYVYYISDMGSEAAKKNSTYATDVRDRLGKAIGTRLELDSRIRGFQNYIMVDTSCLSYTKGAIKVEDGNLILYGSYHSIDYVIEYFFDTVIGENKKVSINETIELDSGDLPTVYSKEDLMAVLQYAYDNDDVLIVGDEIGGNRDVPSNYLEKYKNGNLESGGSYTGTGRYPAIMGVDMGRCGMLLAFLEDHEWGTISQIVCESIDFAAQGGILTYASHFRNPSLSQTTEWQSDRGTIGGAKEWTELITPGTELNTNMMFELERIAKVLGAFDEAGVPIIWRPMHEMNGAWFWWTPYEEYSVLDAKYYVNFWRYIYNYFTVDCGLDNLIWHYSPSTNESKASSMYFYPGDEYCDILGVDWYTDGSGPSQKFVESTYGDLMATGKIVNLAEIGIGDALVAETIRDQESLYSAHDFFRTTIEAMRGEGLKAAFFATYTGNHTLAYLPGGDEIMQSEYVIDLSEMPALFEKVTGFKVEN